MSKILKPKQPLNELINTCREQTERYTQRENYDPSACFEIWRRAIVDRDEQAWQALFEQYGSYVRKWLQQRMGSAGVLQFEEEALINGVFINVYRFLTPEKFGSFNTLPAILQYLKMCCWTVMADAQRDLQARKLDTSLDARLPGAEPGNTAEATPNPVSNLSSNFELEEWVLDKVDRAVFWEGVWSRLEDNADRKLVYLRYILDMPPREITQLYPLDFPNVQEVYRRNKNLLWRLRNTKF
jgi:DNA-directed RNA polymerase specialized sigma24 family protein